MFVIIATVGFNFAKLPSLSSASTTIHSPFPSFALLSSEEIIPPFMIVGSIPFSSIILAISEVVVVLP